MIDEDETAEIVTLGGKVRVLHVGLDMAECLNRSRYIDGLIEVEEYEREVERLMRKREAA